MSSDECGLMQLHLEGSAFDRVTAWLGRLLALDPMNPQVLELFCVLLCQVGREELALRRLDEALAERPADAEDEPAKVLRFMAATLRRYYQAAQGMRVSPGFRIFDTPDEPLAARLWRKALIEYARKSYQRAIEFLFALDPRHGEPRSHPADPRDLERLRSLILQDLGIRREHFRDADGKRALIIRSTSSGFCADVAHVIVQLAVAQACGRTPLVYWGRESAYADPSIDNLWTEFFEPVSSISLNDLASRDARCFPPPFSPKDLRWSHNAPWFQNDNGASLLQIVPRDEEIVVAERYSLISELLYVLPDDHPSKRIPPLDFFLSELARGVRLKAAILSEPQSWLDQHRQDGGPIIGVHLRLSSNDKVGDSIEQAWPDFDAVIRRLRDFVEQYPAGRIFLMSDYQPYVDRMHDYLPGRVIERPATRLVAETVRMRQLGLDAPTGNYHLAVEMVRDIATAAQCDAFMGDGASSVSTVIAGLAGWDSAQVAWIRAPNVIGSRWTEFTGPPQRGGRTFSVQSL
jgi:hypothetical protein